MTAAALLCFIKSLCYYWQSCCHIPSVLDPELWGFVSSPASALLVLSSFLSHVKLHLTSCFILVAVFPVSCVEFNFPHVIILIIFSCFPFAHYLLSMLSLLCRPCSRVSPCASMFSVLPEFVFLLTSDLQIPWLWSWNVLGFSDVM